MVHIDIDIDWNAINEASAALLRGVRMGVALGVKEGAEEARSVHRWKNKTGVTEQGIQGVHTPSADGAEGLLESIAEHSSFLEEGTRPHEIRPKEGEGFRGPLAQGQSRRKKGDIGTHRVALRWESDGEIHFAKVVHHPGTQASPYMGPAVLKFERVVEREVEIGCANAERILNR